MVRRPTSVLFNRHSGACPAAGQGKPESREEIECSGLSGDPSAESFGGRMKDKRPTMTKWCHSGVYHSLDCHSGTFVFRLNPSAEG